MTTPVEGGSDSPNTTEKNAETGDGSEPGRYPTLRNRSLLHKNLSLTGARERLANDHTSISKHDPVGVVECLPPLPPQS